MNALRILVVDDEPLARENLRLMLDGVPGCTIIGEAADVAAARRILAEDRIDLVLLDILMPGASGLELAAELSGHDAPLVVVVTAHSEFAVPAFGVRAADFLLKPFDEARLAAALEVAAQRRNERASYQAAARRLVGVLKSAAVADSGSMVDGDRMIIRDGRRVLYLPLDEVVNCRSSRNYIRVHTRDKWHLVRYPLGALVAQLDPDRFVRVHRTGLVNLSHVVEVSPTHHGDFLVRLSTGARVRLSRRRREAIARLLHRDLSTRSP